MKQAIKSFLLEVGKMIEIVVSGMMTSIQDKGRYGYQAKGVSVSGAMDLLAYKIANILVGIEEDAACIEMAYLGPTIKFHESMEVALTGGEFSPRLNNKPVPMYETLFVQAGDILVCGHAQTGIYGYLSFSCQLDIPKVLGSYATDIKSSIGGFEGCYLKSGDMLGLKSLENRAYLKKRLCPKLFRYPYGACDEIKFTRGIEYNRFLPAKTLDKRIMLEVTSVCSRMGYRLKGENLSPISGEDMISEGLSQGTIQGTPSGEWIVMMSDRQSVGGYPRVGHVITVDLVKLVHCRPKEKIYFKEISVEEAQASYRDLFNQVIKWRDSLTQGEKRKVKKKQQFSVHVNQTNYKVEVTSYEEEDNVL